ncbi:uncharacterized protein LOC123543259 [Mercenaria mercenaria]|uniref:uncharacterized protein LOC123543259 n=1 Tax=Mercenaria mercenaria TaxID=6596 RepID=UPI00234E3DB4|nr:uncharacterized protein LOC123543259 [Mercenaria mercenaria]
MNIYLSGSIKSKIPGPVVSLHLRKMLCKSVCDLALLLFIPYVVCAPEPICSKFSFEEQLLEKMVRTEFQVNTMEKEMKRTQENVLQALKEYSVKTTNLINDFENLKNNIAKEMEKKTNELQLIEERMEYPAIAFHAHHVTKTSISSGETIVFDRFVLNEGSGYGNLTGIFTSPEGGLYQFNVHVCSTYSNSAHFSIVLEGNALSKTSQFSNDYCGSISAVARVKTGERVWVKATSTSTLHEDSYRWNTFSGALIHK